MKGSPNALVATARGHRADAAVCALWLMVNGMLIWKNGIVTTGEAEKYLDQARVLLSTGKLETANFNLYFLPIALLAACIRLRLSFAWFVAVQLLLNALATLVFYRTADRLFAGTRAAIVVTVLLLLNLPYQAYNSFLQTESIFQSVSLILVCLMLRTKSPSPGRVVVLLLLPLILSVTRPNGLLYWPVVWVFLCVTALRGRPAWLKGSLLAFGFGFSLLLLNLAMGSGGELDFILPFREQHIVCGVPTLLAERPPATSPGGNSIWGLFGYIIHHMGLFSRLAFLKTLYFWGLLRDYFSRLHNAWLALYFYPPALAAFVSLAWWRRHRPLALFCLLAPVLLTWTMVMLTCDDWHNRVYLGISPFLFFLGQPLWSGTLQRTWRRRTRS